MHLSPVIFVNGKRLLCGCVDDTSGSWCKVIDVGNITLEEPFVLGIDLGAVRRQAWEAGNGREAFWIVELGPWVVNALDLIGDKFACKDAQCEAMACVAGHDVGVAQALVESHKGT